MNAWDMEHYQISDTSEILSPALVVFRPLVRQNIDQMIRIAGGASRLRPHCKTHKMAAVTQMELAAGIVKHKCATLAEAQMLADAGVKDIFLAYNLVGPNIQRAVRFLDRYPDVRLSVTADHPEPLQQLSKAFAGRPHTIGVILDVNTGLNRTGVDPESDEALQIYRLMASLPGLRPEGLHAYDGQNHQTDVEERRQAVMRVWEAAARLRDRLLAAGLPVPRIVAGGTGSFPIFARLDDPAIEVSPGTTIFHDWGYGTLFPDLPFAVAALLLTRVISRPTANRLTVDLGNKAVAADPPMGQRVFFPDLPDARQVLHNEEHLVLETDRASAYQPGDVLLAIPRHICPTCAWHQMAWVIEGGRVVDRWPVTARDRWIDI
ncbi:MAG: threonine aldolase [Pirellulaceae bacterium]|nr:MAG: threonine aldolase [Pirellulaceae bacterium]